jgi:hypothetical protein
MYHPLVPRVMDLHVHYDEGNLAPFISDDDPAVIHDGLTQYRLSVVCTRGEDMRRRNDKRKREHEASMARQRKR